MLRNRRAPLLGGAAVLVLASILVFVLARPFSGAVSYDDAREDFNDPEAIADPEESDLLPAWTMDDLDRGDGRTGALYAYLRDAELSPEAAALVFTHLDLATTIRSVTEEAAPDRAGRANPAALTVARVYRALSANENLPDLRSALASDEAADAAVHLAHLLSTYSVTWIGGAASLGVERPDVATRTIDGLGTVGAIPFVDERWIGPVLDLALVSDESFAELADGMRLQMATMAHAAARSTTRESRSSGQQVVAAQVALAHIARAVLADEETSDEQKRARLRALLDRVAVESESTVSRLERRGLPASDEDPLPGAITRDVGEGADDVLETLEKGGTFSIEDAVDQIVRLGTYRLVLALQVVDEVADISDVRVPEWEEVSALERSEYEQLLGEWEDLTDPLELSPAEAEDTVRRVLED